jgi:hypothetical protein
LLPGLVITIILVLLSFWRGLERFGLMLTYFRDVVRLTDIYCCSVVLTYVSLCARVVRGYLSSRAGTGNVIVLVYSDRRVNAVYGWFADLDVVMFCSGGWPVVYN